jgi:diguanylate cyclase (GGDEF)-like protein
MRGSTTLRPGPGQAVALRAGSPATQAPPHPRTLGWVRTTALAMGGSNQSLFLLGALLLAQGTAAIPLLAVGLLLAFAAMPGWIELLLMWPNRVGGIAAVCGEAFRPYSAVLANLAGTCYWWGWVPTCGLTSLLSAEALHSWYFPGLPVTPLAIAILLSFAALNLLGVRKVTNVAVVIAVGAGGLAFLSVIVPVVSGHVDWGTATSYSLRSPFQGVFGSVTSSMAGLYLIGFAAPAFEAAGCHVGETVDPVRSVPRAFYASAAMAFLFFIIVPVVWYGALGAHPLEGDLARELAPVFTPWLGGLARGAAVWLLVLNMFHGTLQPLAGASRTLSQLSEDGLLPRVLARRSRRDVPWVATALTAGMSIIFLLLGDPVWMIAAANLTYLIGIALPSVAVWLLRRHSPELDRPYRAPRGTIGLGLVAAAIWALTAALGFQQFGLPVVVFGMGLAYSGAALYAWRRWTDRRLGGPSLVKNSLHKKLTGAMLLVMALDSVGYLVAVAQVDRGASPALVATLEDIFVAVSLITISVGLILPGMISHTAGQVAEAADRLASGTLADLTRAMESLASGDLEAARARVDSQRVVVHTADELGAMAVSFNTMQDEVGRTAVALGGARDNLRDARRHLEHLAATDPLTGLWNRRHLEDELERESARQTPATAAGSTAALLVLDLDSFKYVNDSHGHAVGDSVLQSVARLLTERLRATDVIARLGGDEFAVLLRDVPADRALDIARDLAETIRMSRFPVQDSPNLRLSISIGITAFDPADGLSASELLVSADIAMYDAKATGRDRVSVAAPDLDLTRAKIRQTWPQNIREALEQDALELHAQPILELASGRITQYELLVRLRSSSGELIPPGAFIEIAERSGAIRDIDLWVLRSACRIIREEDARGRISRMEVNVSGVSISDPHFLEMIRPELAGLGALGTQLVFELTETAAVTNLANATDFVEAITPFGCGLALDDFGVGFGSFYYLKHLPCQYLKIDGEFIRTLATSPADQVFVRAMVELARGLGKSTIAEFVEDAETLRLITELGVDFAQGYFVGRPAPLPDSGLEADPALEVSRLAV